MKWQKNWTSWQETGDYNYIFLMEKTVVFFFFHLCKHSLRKMGEMGVIEDLKWRQWKYKE